MSAMPSMGPHLSYSHSVSWSHSPLVRRAASVSSRSSSNSLASAYSLASLPGDRLRRSSPRSRETSSGYSLSSPATSVCSEEILADHDHLAQSQLEDSILAACTGSNIEHPRLARKPLPSRPRPAPIQIPGRSSSRAAIQPTRSYDTSIYTDMSPSLQRSASNDGLRESHSAAKRDAAMAASPHSTIGLGIGRSADLGRSTSSLPVPDSFLTSYIASGRRPSQASEVNSCLEDGNGSEEDLEEILATPGTLLMTMSSASRDAIPSPVAIRRGGAPESLSLDRSHRRDVASSALVSPRRLGGDDLPGAKARRILGIESTSVFDMSPDKLQSSDDLSGAPLRSGSRLKFGSLRKRSKQSSDDAQPAARRLSSRAARLFSPAPQSWLEEGDGKARLSDEVTTSSLASPVSPYRRTSGPYRFPVSPSRSSAHSGYSTGPSSPASIASFGPSSITSFGSVSANKGRKASQDNSVKKLSAAEQWEKQLEEAAKTAQWQSSIEHRPRRQQSRTSASKATTAAPISRQPLVNYTSDDETWRSRRERQGSVSSIGSLPGVPAFDRQRRPSADPYLVSVTKSAAQSTAPKAAPERPPKSHARTLSNASSIEYMSPAFSTSSTMSTDRASSRRSTSGASKGLLSPASSTLSQASSFTSYYASTAAAASDQDLHLSGLEHDKKLGHTHDFSRPSEQAKAPAVKPSTAAETPARGRTMENNEQQSDAAFSPLQRSASKQSKARRRVASIISVSSEESGDSSEEGSGGVILLQLASSPTWPDMDDPARLFPLSARPDADELGEPLSDADSDFGALDRDEFERALESMGVDVPLDLSHIGGEKATPTPKAQPAAAKSFETQQRRDVAAATA